MVRALVTGAAGFVGHHLVRRLGQDRAGGSAAQITALLRPQSKMPAAWVQTINPLYLADWSRRGLSEMLTGQAFDIIYHLAAHGVHPGDRDPRSMLAINVELPAVLTQLAIRQGAAVVTAGCYSEYAPPARELPVAESDPLESANLYGGSKAAGGLMARATAAEGNVRFRHLRLFNVFGTGEAPDRLLPTLIGQLAAGKRAPLTEGRQIRDFVYIVDAVEAMVAVGNQLLRGEGPPTAIWNVATGTGSTVRRFSEQVADALGAPTELLGFGDRAMRRDETPWLVGDPGLIERELGWRARYDVRTGLEDCVARLLPELTGPNATDR